MENSLIKELVEEFQKVLQTSNLVGDPMEFEDKIIIPFSKFGFGFGSGSGEETKGKSFRKEGGKGKGVGAGGGGGLAPAAVIVVFKGISGPEGIKVLQLKGESKLAQAATSFGETFSKMMAERSMEKE